jgi:hypothetical protein
MLDREPHDGGTDPQLLGDVEAALAALKGSAVSDRDTQTVEVMERLIMAVTAELDEGRTRAMKPRPPVARLLYEYVGNHYTCTSGSRELC